RDGVDLDLAARNAHRPRFAVLARAHGQLDRRPGLAADLFDDVAGRLAGCRDAVDLEDDVVRAQPRLVRRAAAEHCHDARLAGLGGVELDADPDIRTLQRVVARGALLGRHEVGVAGVANR